MKLPVVALIGAGASHVCGPGVEVAARPPLTTQLFKTTRAVDLLREYSLAQDAGFVIEDEMSADNSVAFEQALAALVSDDQPHRQQMALAVPPFLQALLLQYSAALSTESRRYSRLVDALLGLGTTVHFVSLNYDTLLDQRLANYTPLSAVPHYVNTRYGWSLIKPHGSVAWYREQGGRFDPRRFTPGFEPQQSEIQVVDVRHTDIADVRERQGGRDPHGPTSRYPALALPMGSKDELVLPPLHLEAFQELLGTSRQIDLLILGYSGIDTEVLELIEKSSCQVRRMTIVNASGAAALEVYDRVTGSGIDDVVWADVVGDSYEAWIDNHGLRRWVDEFDGAGQFPSRTDPRLLRQKLELAEYHEALKPQPRTRTAGIRNRAV